MNPQIRELARDWLSKVEGEHYRPVASLTDDQLITDLNFLYDGGYKQFVADSEEDAPTNPNVRIESSGVGESAQVKGFVGEDQMETVIIYRGGVQSSRTLPTDLDRAEAIVDCYKQAIAEYRRLSAL